MTTKEALLLKVMEECDELSQRCSKAIRFGLDEIQEGQNLTNEERLVEEYRDLKAAMNMLVDKNYIKSFTFNNYDLTKRIDKIDKYLDYSRKLGTIID